MSRKTNRPPKSGLKLTRRTFAAGLAATGIVAGTSPFNIVRAQAAGLKVGVLLPRSGAQAGIGQDCQRGVEITQGLKVGDLLVVRGFEPLSEGAPVQISDRTTLDATGDGGAPSNPAALTATLAGTVVNASPWFSVTCQ